MPEPTRIGIALFDLDLSPAGLARLHRWLDAEEQARAASYRFDHDRHRFVARRGQLRLLLAQMLGCSPREIRYACNAHGKPALAEPCGLRFNLSQSDALALCATSWDAEIGCDIERRNPVLACPAVASDLFSPHEVEALAALPRAQWTEGFFNCWTRKEAYVKALGMGLSHPLDSFSVSVAPQQPARLIEAAPGWSLAAFDPAPGYHAAVVAEGPVDL